MGGVAAMEMGNPQRFYFHIISPYISLNFLCFFPIFIQVVPQANRILIRLEELPERRDTIRRIFEKKGVQSSLPDHLREVRVRLADENKTKPHWIANDVLDDLVRIWESEDFKKLSKKNKSNRNSNSGGLGASLHSCGSIPMTEHRRRLDTMNELRQTQTEASDAELWFGGHRWCKEGRLRIWLCFDGRNSRNEGREQNKFIREELSKMGAIFAQFSANPEFLSSFNVNNSGSPNSETQAPSNED
nr:putative transposase En/Spm [Ipomoea batatas]